ncbi:hypothetical protein IMSHALPRED_010847 [Imshaugia aleurites]|uniref:Uncharacterized protein n=1 Tax=Imshaugia aleurites TaxID=172621 RepID=A0A8H3GBG6_9LECA|nr:hypothetical protein IMSHALPRED_010847 [Imshaugia aleurites]
MPCPGIVIKVAQKVQIANYVLSMSHHLCTGWTTALIHGNRVALTSDRQEETVPSISKQIRALIVATPTLWAHPLLLPNILLKNYMNRAEVFAWTLDDQVVGLEDSIGVTFSGRLRRDVSTAPQNIELPNRSDMRKLTMRTHTVLTEIIFFSRVVTFNRDCAAYLLKTGDEMSHRIPPQRRASLFHASRELQGTAKYMEFSSTSMQGLASNLKERVLSQIQVLYSISAQTDNRLSARIAVSSGRDSTAMKTLAFITAFFLPGTYIATLFSMGMFEWQASLSSPSSSTTSSSSVLSSKFWIYWATTIPLTIAVIVSWRLWWVREDQAYTAQLAGEMDGMVAKDDGPNYMLHERDLAWLRRDTSH